MGKITKIAINPERKINLGDYESTTLSAFIEMTFATPLDPDEDKTELEEHFNKLRKLAKEEFKRQYKPYKKIIDRRKNG